MGVTTENDGTAFGFAVDGPARFKGGGMGEAVGLNEDRRFCAEDLRRIVGRCCEADSPTKWAMTYGARCRGQRANESLSRNNNGCCNRQIGQRARSRVVAPYLAFITMADVNAIAKQFVDYYYNLFSDNRSQLAALYVCLLVIRFRQSNFLPLAGFIDAELGSSTLSRCS